MKSVATTAESHAVLSFVEASADAIVGRGLDGIVTTWNPAAEALFGWTASEMLGRSVLSICPPDHQHEEAQIVQRVVSGERLCDFRTLRVRKNGEAFAVSISVSPMLDADGRVVGIFGAFRDVTRAEAAERALRESEATHRLLAENMLDLVIVTSPAGEWLYASPASERILEYAPQELVGKRSEEIIHPDDLAAVRTSRATIVAGASGVRRFRYRTKSGAFVWIESTSNPVRDQDGRVTSVVSVLRDVTDRIALEQALETSQQTYRILAEHASDVVASRRPDLTFEYVSPSSLAVLGYAPEEFATLDIDEHIHPDDLPEVLRTREASRVEGNSTRAVFRFRRKSGDHVWIEAVGGPVRDDQGRVLRVVSSLRDITLRKATEERLRESEERYRLIAENASDLVITSDPDGTWRFASPSCRRLLGYEPEELVGKRASDLLHPDDRAAILALRQAILAGGRPAEAVFRFRRKDGRFAWFEARATPVLDEAGTTRLLVSTMRDITERKAREAALDAATRELARSNADLQQFAYIASHDLKEPLRAVSSFVSLLQKKYEGRLDADADRYIGFAVQGASRMRDLIDGLLEYSRVSAQMPTLAPVELEKVLDSVKLNLKVAIEEGGATVEHGPLPTVLGDRRQLTQLVQNLVANAMKFQARGATPLVRVEATRQEDGAWVVSVTDNGIGIPPELHDQLFTLFRRLRSRDEYPGTGIGLAVCKRIVEHHGGRIWIDPAPRDGTTFRFTLQEATR